MSKFRLGLCVFICGAVVMIYEIAGSRVVAPYIGNSLYVWTSLIGIILAALSVGYSVGGRIADKYPSVGVLATTVFGAGGLIAATTLIKDSFLVILSASALPLELISALASVFLFAPAAFFLGFVSPYAARLSIKEVENSGQTVGSIYTLSTAGSIVGTFVSGFVLIPYLGTNRTLYVVIAMTFGASLLLVPDVVSRIKTSALTLALIAIALVEVQSAFLSANMNMRDIDTRYNRVRIFDVKKDGRDTRVMTTDPFSVQSSLYLDSNTSAAGYTEFLDIAFEFNPEIKRVLLIGGAAMSFPKDLLRERPELQIDVVEIDPGMTSLAKQYFQLDEKPGFRIFHEDGRRFLNRVERGSYDLIILDAFNSLLFVPFHLSTLEFVRHIQRALTPKGVMVANVNGAITGAASKFSQSAKRTADEVFPYSRVFRVDKKKVVIKPQSLIVVAADFDLRFIGTRTDEFENNEIFLKKDEGIVLTDDFAPVERFISEAFAEQN